VAACRLEYNFSNPPSLPPPPAGGGGGGREWGYVLEVGTFDIADQQIECGMLLARLRAS
jgi:hypothetical protein